MAVAKALVKLLRRFWQNLVQNVTLVARSANILPQVLSELPVVSNQDHDFLVADFTDLKDVSRKVKTLCATKPIHILVNNTGGPKSGSIISASPAEFLDGFQKHVLISQTLVQLVLEGMKKSNYGRIVNIISTSVKEPIPGLGVSNTIRGAMGNWSKTMATELAPFGITVNNVLPGFTATDRLFSLMEARAKAIDVEPEVIEKQWLNTVPMRRFAQPKEVAAAIGFLSMPAAGYITGINIPVDGGRTKSL